MTEGSSPSVVRVVTVTTDDAVAALEANLRRDRGLVLRLTPPFHGRQRARLHRPTPSSDGDAGTTERAVHVDPASLFPDAPAYPEVDETAARLGSQAEYDPDRHYEAHAERVAEWRAAVREARAASVTLGTADGPHRVEVRWLG
jgi:hypothetical protein